MGEFQLLENSIGELDFSLPDHNDSFKHLIKYIVELVFLMPHLMHHLKNVVVIKF